MDLKRRDIGVMLLFILFWVDPVAVSEIVTSKNMNVATPCNNEDQNCITNPANCQEICGCDSTYTYDKEKGECVVNIEYLKEITASKNYVSADNDMVLEDRIETKLRKKVDKIFQGIIASALFFVVCATICVLSVCVFCCHIHRSDGKLKKEVDTLAKKLKIDNIKKDAPLLKKTPRPQIEESCNVVVQDADIMCV